LVYNTDVCIAYKNKQGVYGFDHTSMFNLYDISKRFPIEGFKKQGKTIRFEVKCSICDEKHIFEYQINDLINREMIIGGCEVVNKPILVLGKPMKVLNFIRKYNEINKEIYAML
jgi:hypothetical protein